MSTKREVFLLLFYRERLCRLIQRLELQIILKEKFKKQHKKYPWKEYDATIPLITEWLKMWETRAEDHTRCNDICKSMYFCDRKKGHKGKHAEWGGDLPIPEYDKADRTWYLRW